MCGKPALTPGIGRAAVRQAQGRFAVLRSTSRAFSAEQAR